MALMQKKDARAARAGTARSRGPEASERRGEGAGSVPEVTGGPGSDRVRA